MTVDSATFRTSRARKRHGLIKTQGENKALAAERAAVLAQVRASVSDTPRIRSLLGAFDRIVRVAEHAASGRQAAPPKIKRPRCGARSPRSVPLRRHVSGRGPAPKDPFRAPIQAGLPAPNRA